MDEDLLQQDGGDALPPVNFAAASPVIGAPIATLAAAAANAAVAASAAGKSNSNTCTVRLRLWDFNPAARQAALTRARMTVDHVVLCSEMGTHFSPCGRYLAACVECRPREATPAASPSSDVDMGSTPGHPQEAAPPAAGQGAGQGAALMHELRVYSLLPDSFGHVVAARALRAAQCLTSIQWSPTGEHLLVAYGRQHVDLLRSFVARGDAILPVYTVIDVYRVVDMALVRSLPSAVDGVNVAAFHPHPGGGIVYGTKEGRLRLLHHSRGGGEDLARAERLAPQGSSDDSLLSRNVN